jgi:hypothetical protein
VFPLQSFEKKPVVLDGELTPKKRKTSPERSPRTTKVEVVENGKLSCSDCVYQVLFIYMYQLSYKIKYYFFQYTLCCCITYYYYYLCCFKRHLLFCFVGAMLGWGRELTEEEESVRATWEQLGTTHEGYLGQTELRLVCKAVGLERAADELVQQLFQRLGVEPDGRISFEQFLHLFRSGLSTSTNNTDSTDHQILVSTKYNLNLYL